MMKIDWDVPITLADGLVLRADVFRPVDPAKYPVIISYGPYGKWLHFEDLYTDQWRRMAEQHPDVVAGSTNKYQNWEVVDPEKWVPDGYACVRVDSRGCGRAPGRAPRGYRSRMNGDWVSGPPTLSEEELGANRNDFYDDCWKNPLASDGYWRSRMPDWSKVKVPLFSAANWGGQGLHPRGNFEGFVRSESDQKWLEVHGIEHWTHFYTDYGVALEKKFFGHFLKGEDTGWAKQPKVLLQVRHPGERFVERPESEWPLARTQWTRLYLNPGEQSLVREPLTRDDHVRYAGLGEGLTFLTPPLERDTEITGPLAAKLYVSSETSDADLFLIVRLFTPNMSEVTFQGALDPHTPIAQGWLRASHRKLDPKLTQPYRPYHTHDEKQPLTPGQVYELDVEIWPTSIVAPAGYRLGLTVRGRDYEYPGGPSVGLGTLGAVFTGVGPLQHNDPRDRPPEVFGKSVTVHCGPSRPSHVLLPVIPAR